jgi:hypothetical protein
MPSPPPHRTVPAAPLWVWCASLALVILLGVTSLAPFLRYRSEQDRAFFNDCATRIDALGQGSGATGAKAPIRIIGIGSSLLYRATYNQREMSEFAQIEGFAQLDFLRLTRGGAELLQFAPLMDRIIAARPDILLIQADLLTYRWHSEREELFHQHAEYVKLMLIRGLSLIAGNPSWLRGQTASPVLLNEAGDTLADGRMPGREKPPLQDVAEEAAGKARALNDRLPVTRFDAADPVLQTLKRARERGIRIVLLGIPRISEVEVLIPQAERRRERELLRQTEELFGARYIAFDRSLGPDCFEDSAHLNKRGRAEFSRWLITQMHELHRHGGS